MKRENRWIFGYFPNSTDFQNGNFWWIPFYIFREIHAKWSIKNSSISTLISISTFIFLYCLLLFWFQSENKSEVNEKETLLIYINQFWHEFGACFCQWIHFFRIFFFIFYNKKNSNKTERGCNVIHWQLAMWVFRFSSSLIMLFRFNEAVSNVCASDYKNSKDESAAFWMKKP